LQVIDHKQALGRAKSINSVQKKCIYAVSLRKQEIWEYKLFKELSRSKKEIQELKLLKE